MFSVAPAVVFLLTALVVGSFKLNSQVIVQNAMALEVIREK